MAIPDPIVRTALVVLALVAGFAALKLAEDIFAPLTLALVAGFILAPLADLLERLRLPHAVVAMALPLLGLFVIFAFLFSLEPLVGRLIDQWPVIKWELRRFLDGFRGLIQGIGAVNDEVERALGRDGGSAASAARAIPSVTDALFVAPRVAAKSVIFFAALFFFLLTRDRIYAWLSERVSPALGAAVVLHRIRTAERLVSRYFLTITMINAGLGTAVAVAMALAGMPGAIGWGVAAMILNYVLYLGPATMVASLAVGGAIAFDGLGALLPAALYLSLNMTEAQFVTPSFVGRNISVNPLLIFVSLVFWLWLWGPLGGVIAIPVLVITLAMLDAFDEKTPPEAVAAEAG